MAKIISIRKKQIDEECRRAMENAKMVFRSVIKRMDIERNGCEYRTANENGLACCGEPTIAKEACKYFTGITAYRATDEDIESLAREYDIDSFKSEEVKSIMLENLFESLTKTAICSYKPPNMQ